MTDYTIMAIESSICDLKIIREHLTETMRLEADFIRECLDTGMIILEAETKAPASKAVSNKSSIWNSIKNTIKSFFEKIKSLFRKKAIEQSEKYVPWIKANKEHLSKTASTMSIELLPYWEGNYTQHAKDIKTVVDGALRNIQNKRFSHDYASRIVNPKNITDNNLIEYLKNYYRVGDRDKLKVEQTKLTGKELVTRVGNMMDYVVGYAGNLVPTVDKLATDIVSAIDKINGTPMKPTSYKISAESYLMIEGCQVQESDLVTCVNYTSVFEAEGDKKEPIKPDEKKRTEVVTSDGEKTSVTKVTVTDKSNSSTSEDNRSDEEIKFANEVTRFIKLAFSAYTTVLEERFITYINVLRAIGNTNKDITNTEDSSDQDDDTKENTSQTKKNIKDEKKALKLEYKKKGKELRKTLKNMK